MILGASSPTVRLAEGRLDKYHDEWKIIWSEYVVGEWERGELNEMKEEGSGGGERVIFGNKSVL